MTRQLTDAVGGSFFDPLGQPSFVNAFPGRRRDGSC